jgi:hypothetical protein
MGQQITKVLAALSFAWAAVWMPAQGLVPAAQAQMETSPARQSFGEAGQWFVYGGSALEAQNHRLALGSASTTSFVFDLHTAVGAFVLRNGFVEMGVGVSRHSESTLSNVPLPAGSRTALTLAPGVGINVPLFPQISFAPRLALAYSHSWVSDLLTSDNFSLNELALDLRVPALFHLTSHLSLSVALHASQTVLTRDSSTVDNRGLSSTQYGVLVGFVGWFW